MSAFSDLLHWLEFKEFQDLEPLDIQKMLTEALDELTAGKTEEHREALFVVQTVLSQLKSDMDPLPGLRFLLDRYRRIAEQNEEPIGIVMERELRQTAMSLEEERWRVGAYPVLEEGIRQHLSGRSESLGEVLDELDLLLGSAWEPNADMSVMEEEITVETVVGHRILKEGFDNWFRALDEVELAAGQAGDFQQALAFAEDGSRLLVAFQMGGVGVSIGR